jgi:protein O-GlcNAc transferase
MLFRRIFSSLRLARRPGKGVSDRVERAVSLLTQGFHAEARALLVDQLTDAPGDGIARQLLASIALGQGRPAEALAQLDAIDAEPTAETSFLRADALSRMGHIEEALAEYRALQRRAPEFTAGHAAYGTFLSNLGRWDAAVAALREADRLDPGSTAILNNLGNALKHTGEIREAVRCFESVIAREPDFMDARQSRLFLLHYLPDATPDVLFAAHREFNDRHAAPLAAIHAPHRNAPRPDRRLRVGYVSGDLRRHPVGYFIKPVIEAHDRDAVSVIGYATSAQRDDLTAGIEAACDVWRQVDALDDAVFAEMIRADAIDILVDLSGHTPGQRLLTFARRPAPVQATWLGYLDTTGLDAIDYIIVDPLFMPPAGSRQRLSEAPLELRRSYLCFQPPDYAPDVSALPALKGTGMRFGSFNNLAKINEKVIALWAEVLKAVPHATLVLKTHDLARAPSREWLTARFGAHAIEPARLDLRSGASHRELLAAYAEIDVALDPFPYTGGLTTLEALWMGVPVITLAGDTLLGRMGVTCLGNAGLPEFVADSPTRYVEIAVRCAHELSWLARIREEMRQRLARSPLLDAAGFTRDLEAGYRRVWRNWCGRTADANPR